MFCHKQSIVREKEPYITLCERYGDNGFVLDTYRGEETQKKDCIKIGKGRTVIRSSSSRIAYDSDLETSAAKLLFSHLHKALCNFAAY
jgi:hypothetical protein